MAFEPENKDYELSPYTGLTRESWIEAAKYLLEGIFSHIESMEHPVVVPRQETVVTYPHANAPEEVREMERRAEIFEGLARSFFLAAPLIHCEPEVEICGFKLRDYYKNQVLRICTPGDAYSAGSYEQLKALAGENDHFRCFQQTVETAALVICLWTCRDEVWADYTKEEKDVIATFLSGFAHGNTVPQNWRLFNMLDLAFLYREGYAIDEEIMRDHAQAILEYYAGDGWYRDGQCFDDYSCWAFQFYAPLWCVWYGYEKEPYLAAQFEAHSNELMEHYENFFDVDGYTLMWGRSSIYRFATVSAFDGNLLLKHSAVNPGLSRRISSGCLMQFMGREDFLWNGLPTMGFYRQFSPLVQGYSCAESPFWMGKAFLCLHFPAEHPFWTQKECGGSWETLRGNEVKETVLNGPGLCVTNHRANGETVLRSGKVVKHQNDLHGMWNYSKLSYNSKYPWEATPAGGEGAVESCQYVLTDKTEGYRSYANITYWVGEQEGVLYRKQYFDYRTEVETHYMQCLYLADFPVAEGLFRVDKLKLWRRPVMLTLGSYGFPDNGTDVTVLEENGARAIVLTGKNAVGQPRQMAMTVYGGWEELTLLKSTGSNPDSEHSLVIAATTSLQKQYGGREPYIFPSQILTRESEVPFTMEEIFPVERICYADKTADGTGGTGAFGPVELWMKDGSRKRICFEGMEGKLSL